jgi:hypothetical protein
MVRTIAPIAGFLSFNNEGRAPQIESEPGASSYGILFGRAIEGGGRGAEDPAPQRQAPS